MDGTYGNVFPTTRAMTPSAPAPTPSGNFYKVNVNRQKTKKWANFKPQNYDGDDWGDEYDDPIQEAEFPMPPKPMGPRSPVTSSPTSRQFPGSPLMRTPTPQSPVSSLPGGLSRRTTEPLESPQHGLGQGRPQLPSDARSGSPAQQSSHPLPSQLPYSKSNVGPDDVADSPGAVRRSDSSPKPWMDARSASPSGTLSPASINKPLPLIRPADVYQRMQEERERERQSLDTSKSPQAHPEGLSQPLHPPPPENTRRNGMLHPTSGPTSAAESQSGHGSERVLASHGDEEPSAESPTAQQEEPQESPLLSSPQNIRRFSTSPQLPDLSRMSGFGEDLFSSSFLGIRSSLIGSTQLSKPADRIPESDETTAAATDTPGQPTTVTPQQTVTSSSETTAAARADAVLSSPSEPNQDLPVGLPSHEGAGQPVHSASEQQAPATEAERQPAASTQEQPTGLAARPHLPGGWVSDTPSTPAEVALPSQASQSTEAPEKATVAEAQPDVVSRNVPSSHPAEPEQSNLAETNTAKDSTFIPPHQSSARTSPRLQTAAPDMSSPQATPANTDPNASSFTEVEAARSSGLTAAPAEAEHPEIAPTAPLNPRRETPDNNNGAPPILSPLPSAGLTSEPTTDSPVKDNDKLSEEIIKSLSPAQPADSPQTSTSAYQAAAAEPVRESSYLGDVYGDYWTAPEDKAEPGLLLVGKTIDEGKGVQEVPPLPAMPSKEDDSTKPADPVDSEHLSATPPTAPAASSDIEPKSASVDGGPQRHFSWEAPAQASPSASASTPVAELPVEQKSLGYGAENAHPLVEKGSKLELGQTQSTAAQEAEKAAEDLGAEFAPEFNPAATLGAGLGLDQSTESPSPASDSTSKAGEDKRLSLAEEKILFEGSPNPVAPSPPLEQHPVFMDNQQPQQAEPPVASSPKSILGFRNIMELPSPAERIKHYNESRWQFSAVDTGLDEWLQAILSKHPEHASDVLSNVGAAVTPSQGGRVPALHMSNLQHGLSGLGHSSNQVGTKSKELLMAAGKAGKGLFSKGRNKLWGTGDKVFSSS
ncbi:hypothetical protein VTI28DRAFT_9862 [Corynascus sepedonium]